MDPRLLRLFEEGGKDDEVAAILRLDPGGAAPRGVRTIARFGDIATVRVRRGDIPRIHDSASVVSMKPAAPLLREAARAADARSALASDWRRPDAMQATGAGVVFGLVDWGFDFAHPDFRQANGETRLLSLWDQTAPTTASSPAPYGYGAVYEPAAINAALASANPYAALDYDPADSDPDGRGSHGTHVAGIAVGNGRSGGPSGVAPGADIVFVQLTTLDDRDPDIADSTSVLEAIDFIRKVAGDRPWVINLSMGQCGDQHDGTTLIEQAMDAALAEAPGRAIAQSAGNYFSSRQHSSGRLRPGERRSLTWTAPPGDDKSELEIWYSGKDAFVVSLRAPDGALAGSARLGERVQLDAGGRACGTLHNRRRDPNNFDNHVVLWLEPEAPRGAWRLVLDGVDVADGRYHVWLQRSGDDGGGQATFAASEANPFFTTNSICNGHRTIVVGAYDARSDERDVGAFSSAGPTRDGRPKPDLLAPGVEVLSARSTPAGEQPGIGRHVRMTGTSMAVPHVAGAIALLFESAGRLLANEETRALLLSNAEPAERVGRDAIRYGRGYLDVDAAVAASRGPQAESKKANRGSSDMIAAETFHQRLDGLDRSGPLAMADMLIGLGGPLASSPAALLRSVLSAFCDPAAVYPLLAAGLDDPASLFDAIAALPIIGFRQLVDPLFAVVAYPRQRLQAFQPGDLLLRRALGEPGTGHVAFLAGLDAYPVHHARMRGLTTESARSGLYARVVEGGSRPHRLAHRFARRIASEAGEAPADTLILRPRVALKTYRHGAGLSEQKPPAANYTAKFDTITDWASIGLMSQAGIAAGGKFFEPKASTEVSFLAEKKGLTIADGKVILGLFGQSILDKGIIARIDSGDSTKFQVRLMGRICYPVDPKAPDRIAGTEPAPVVAIQHGAHQAFRFDGWKPTSGGVLLSSPSGATTTALNMKASTVDEIGSYLGYEYLQTELARSGIASISIDNNIQNFVDAVLESRADMFLATLDAWRRLVANDPSNPCHGMLDFDNAVGFMGHSRGGDAVVRAAKKNAQRGVHDNRYGLKALCSLSPTDFTGTAKDAIVLMPKDAPMIDQELAYLVVYGAVDGDVAGYYQGTRGPFEAFTGTGFRHYDRAECAKAMAFIKGACHNRFNTNWGTEREVIGTDPDLLPPYKHLEVSTFYIGGFFRWLLGDEFALKRRFTGDDPPPNGVTVALQWSGGLEAAHGLGEVRRIDGFEDPAKNAFGVARVLKFGSVIKFGELKVNGIPQGAGVAHQTSILDADLTGSVPGPVALIETIPAANADWTSFDFLLFRLGRWFDLDKTPFKGAPPRVRVTLKDGAGKEASATEADFFPKHAPGLPFQHMARQFDNGNLMPDLLRLTLQRLETIRIPLPLFKARGLDLKSVQSVSFGLDKKGATHVFIDSLEIVGVVGLGASS